MMFSKIILLLKVGKTWHSKHQKFGIYSNAKSLIANILSLYCQYTISLHIIGKVSQSDFDISSDYSNCPYYQSLGSLNLYCENMFYSRSNFRPGVIALHFPVSQFFVLAAFSLEMFSIFHVLKFFQRFFRAVCRISKYIFVCIHIIEYFFKYTEVPRGFWYPWYENLEPTMRLDRLYICLCCQEDQLLLFWTLQSAHNMSYISFPWDISRNVL